MHCAVNLNSCKSQKTKVKKHVVHQEKPFSSSFNVKMSSGSDKTATAAVSTLITLAQLSSNNSHSLLFPDVMFFEGSSKLSLAIKEADWLCNPWKMQLTNWKLCLWKVGEILLWAKFQIWGIRLLSGCFSRQKNPFKLHNRDCNLSEIHRYFLIIPTTKKRQLDFLAKELTNIKKHIPLLNTDISNMEPLWPAR